MSVAELPLHAGHPGFLLELAGSAVGGLLVAVVLFVLVRRLARSSAAGPSRGTTDGGDRTSGR